MPRSLLVLASFIWSATAMGQGPSRPTDPRQLLSAIGLSSLGSQSVECRRERSPVAPSHLRGTIACWPVRTAVAALAASGESWFYSSDTLDHVYSAQRSWRRPTGTIAPLRDSVARAMTARGNSHVTCRDSVDHPPGHVIWRSLWRSGAYNVILFHQLVEHDSVSLNVQASPGLHAECSPGR